MADERTRYSDAELEEFRQLILKKQYPEREQEPRKGKSD